MPRPPVPSATGEQPCATPHPRTPPFSTRCASVSAPSVTRTPIRRLLLAWSAPVPRSPRTSLRSPSPSAARSERSGPAVVRERTGLAGGAHGPRIPAGPAGGPALRRPGRPGRGRPCGTAPSRAALPGGRPGRPDAAARRGGLRGGGAGRAGLAGVGALPLDLTALGEGDLMEAPLPARAIGTSAAVWHSAWYSAWHRTGEVRPSAFVRHRADEPGPVGAAVRRPVDAGPRGPYGVRGCRGPVVCGRFPWAAPAPCRGPPCGCGPPSLGARSRPRCRRCRPSGAVGAPPISCGLWTRWRRTATACG